MRLESVLDSLMTQPELAKGVAVVVNELTFDELLQRFEPVGSMAKARQ